MPRRSFLSRVNWYRAPLQWGVLALLAVMLGRWAMDASYVPDFEAVCPLGGMQALSSFLVSGSLACSMTAVQIAMGIALLAGVFVAGKLFCGMFCPLGTFTEWLGRLGRRRGWRLQVTPRGLADRLLRAPKYLVLFLSFYYTIEASELFCRTFDPYYAAFTGFGADVDMTWAVVALIALIAGSFFVRQGWCRYLCPLGAASNLPAFPLTLLAVTGAWLAANALGAALSWVWLLAALCGAGFILEAVRMEGRLFPGMKVTRVHAVCTGCGGCDTACPMAIPISETGPVRHIDCTLCTDCVAACPEPGALVIARQRVPWIPGAIALALTAGGLFLGATMHIPTISLRWGDEEAFARAGILERAGMKSIKCFGSSRSFATRMEHVPGVLGVETYVADHRVLVWYDSTVTDARRVSEAMFTPVRYIIAEPDDRSRIARVEFGVDKLFDGLDHFILEELLIQHGHVYALETRFGEPVHTVLWYDPTGTSPDRLRQVIEAESVTWSTKNGQRTEHPAFRARMLGAPSQAALADYRRSMFESWSAVFNGWSTSDTASLATFILPLPAVASARDSLPYLVSHLSDDTAIVRLDTYYGDAGPTLRLRYHSLATTPQRILTALRKDSLYVLFDDGEVGYVGNPYIPE